jgi:pimeloyl-ACP methyl ester carboxylesterase
MIPTRLILPETSFYVPPPDAADLEAALGPNAIVRVAGAGHSIHRDDLDAFLAVIRELIGD